MDLNEKKWHEVHARNIAKRERTHDERLRLRKQIWEIHQNKTFMRKNMKVPKVMSFSESYDKTAKFINEIQESVFEDEMYVSLDFSECEEISAETCVVLAAEIDRCNQKIPESVSGSYPRSVEVYFLLNELGFFHILGIRASKPKFDDLPEVDVVRLQSGSDNPVNLMRGIKELFYPEGENRPNSPFSGRVYRALTEAMGNAVEHAYPEKYLSDNKKTCLPKWWRAGFKLNDENKVIMILYDQGAGIPNTLVTSLGEKLTELASVLTRDPYDDEKIELAMAKGRTRTRVQGRGQGSYDMQRLINESSDGVLSIFSYKGAYRYHSDGSWKKANLSQPLNGTLIVWQICLETLLRETDEKNN